MISAVELTLGDLNFHATYTVSLHGPLKNKELPKNLFKYFVYFLFIGFFSSVFFQSFQTVYFQFKIISVTYFNVLDSYIRI